jgi:hypothetical protein
VLEDCIVSNGEVGIISFAGPSRPYIPCNWQDEFLHRGHIGHHSIFLLRGIGLSSGHSSLFEMAIIFGVLISLTVCTLSNIPFVFRRFEYYFALLYIFYIEYILVFGAGFSSIKNIESGSLVLYCLMFQIFVFVCPSFSISVFISSGLIE